MNTSLSHVSLLKNNMCKRNRKTSAFLNLFLVVSCITFFFSQSLINAKESTVVSIAVIGDSLTQGYGLMVEDNLVSQLQKRVNDKNYLVELQNFGVSGDTTAGGLERFEWSTSSNVSGVIIILGGNDLLRGISPKHSFENLKNMITKAEQKGLPVLLVGMKASTNFGSNFKQEFDRIYSRLEIEHDIFFYPDFFNALNQKDVLSFLSYMQPDGIHPNEAGVKKIVEDFYPTFANFLRRILTTN